MDLIDEGGEAPGNAPEYTVSEISGAVKRTIEGAFGHVRVRGEVGRVSRPRSGHVYLDLKDDRAVLSGIVWKGVAQRLATQPEEGMEVIAHGRLTTYPGQSRYQIIIEDIAPAGMGALMAMLEKRRAALAAEGLFAAERKRPIPYLPSVIGVVTSPSGAVIRDILHRLRERFPRPVLVWPVAVQGERCAGEVAAAVRGFNALAPGGEIPRPDVLIVARGGGSVEDLWGFNDEAVVRAVADSAIPVISAVGHETDTTLIDHAADRRAPTPSAAAEMAVPVRADLASAVAALEARRVRGLAQLIAAKGQRLRDLARALPRPEALLQERMQRLDLAAQRLPYALQRLVAQRQVQLASGPAGRFGPALLTRALGEGRAGLRAAGDRLPRALAYRAERARAALGAQRLPPRLAERPVAEARARLDRAGAALARAGQAGLREPHQRLTAAGRMLESLGYTATLARGYAVVRDDGGAVLTEAARARRAAALEIEFADGRITAAPAGGGGRRKGQPKADPPEEPSQGRLL